jgi:glycosyltransferase involved in cell wall biosynthesis
VISVVVLTLNEERDLPSCLETLRWCDDVHVLDSGSTDRTIEIAREAGAHVQLRRQEGGDFETATQRNWALDNLPLLHEWCLFVDADEQTDAEYVRAIRQAIQSAGGEYNCFFTAPRFIYLGRWLRHTKAYPTWEPRLLRRDQVRLAGGTWDSFGAGARPGYIDKPFDHFPNSKGLEPWVSKHLRYARWEAAAQASGSFGGPASLRRKLAGAVGPLRPLLVPLWFLTGRRAFMDGREGLSYVRRMLIYELLIREALREQRQIKRGRPL